MRWRPPRFTLLLTGLVAVAAAAIVAAGGPGVRAPKPEPPQPVGRGQPERACITTGAQARSTARGVLARTGRATIPLKVSQTVVGPVAAVTATRGGSFTASVQASRHLAVTQHSVAKARACAVGPSLTAARGLAVRRAYALARARALGRADQGAQRGLRALERRVAPLVQVEARAAALRRAEALALAARPGLIRAARRQASRRARGG